MESLEFFDPNIEFIDPDDIDWHEHRSAWSLPDGVTYLNHGSFGPAPDVVIAARQRWFAELERQPMDFLSRRLDPSCTRRPESWRSLSAATSTT